MGTTGWSKQHQYENNKDSGVNVMRLLIVFLFFNLSLIAKESYEIQLIETKSKNNDLELFVNRGKDAGLKCYIGHENRLDGIYYFVRCDKTDNLKMITKSLRLAKSAGLKYKLFKFVKPKQKEQLIMQKKKNIIVNNDLSQKIFGTNEELMQILLNKNNISKNQLDKQKEIYLKNIANNEEFNGLYIKGNSKKNFTKDRVGYDIRLEWSIFDDGYIGSQKDTHRKVLQKELEYEQNINRYQNSNLQLALYKLQSISNFIDFLFLKQQESILLEKFHQAQKEYNDSLITATKIYEFKKDYEKIKRKLYFYKDTMLEPYDLKLKSFIENIERINIPNKNDLINHAYKNGFAFKYLQNKIEKTYIENDWTDRLKTTVFVENKKYLFLDSDSEMIAGVHVQLPLDFKNSDNQSNIIEREVYRLQIENTKKVIANNIETTYHKIEYYKNYIKSLKDEIRLFQKETQTLRIKLKYPLPQQARDINLQLRALKINISKHFQEIWKKRTEILKLVLKLQNLSGVIFLPEQIQATSLEKETVI